MEFFTFHEFEYSDTAKIKHINNVADDSVRRNLSILTDEVLDPARRAFGKPIKVNSGYRSKALNEAIGGSATSQHLTGCAADLDGGDRNDNRRLAKLIVELGLPFDQLIDEKNYAWVHVSHNPGGPQRGEILRITNNKTKHITAEEL